MQGKIKSEEKFKEHKPDRATIQYRQLHFTSGVKCVNCGGMVDKKYELCPHCGYRLHNDHCTFCGAPMDSDDLFCGECAGNRQGVNCPQCGTLSFRSFCPKCNAPVDALGMHELKKAETDPIYQRICDLTKYIVEVQESGFIDHNEKNHISPNIQTMLDRYRQMQSDDAKKNSDMPTKQDLYQELDNHDSQNAITLVASSVGVMDFSSAIKELNELMKSQIPDPGLTPQMQRNYYSARKVTVYHKSIVKEPLYWVCNLCGCKHLSPSGCAQPELGGTWIYQEKEITTKTYE